MEVTAMKRRVLFLCELSERIKVFTLVQAPAEKAAP
jgi:hypothetical protein